jgi:hypothetical protein
VAPKDTFPIYADFSEAQPARAATSGIVSNKVALSFIETPSCPPSPSTSTDIRRMPRAEADDGTLRELAEAPDTANEVASVDVQSGGAPAGRICVVRNAQPGESQQTLLHALLLHNAHIENFFVEPLSRLSGNISLSAMRRRRILTSRHALR